MREKIPQQARMLAKHGKGRILPFHASSQTPRTTGPRSSTLSLFAHQEATDASLHALQNCLQTIGIGLDLLLLTQPVDPQEYESMQARVQHAGHILQELREYHCPPPISLQNGNLAEVVEDTVRKTACKWKAPGQTTRIICHAPLVSFEADWQQIGKTLQRTTLCAYALLPHEGGEITVESGVRSIGSQRFIDLRVRCHSATTLAFDEKMLLSPFVRINDHELGLSLILVQHTVQRLRGQFFFRQVNQQQGCFTLLFRV
jgi:hypothetical protein